MTEYILKWPPGFDDEAWLIEPKGWFAGLEIIIGERIIRPVFYDPVRLAQEVAGEIGSHGVFTEACLIVMGRLTQDEIETAVAKLAESGDLEKLP